MSQLVSRVTPSEPTPRSGRYTSTAAGSTTGRTALVARLATVPALAWFALPLLPVMVWAVADRWSYPALLPQQFGLRGWSALATPATGSALFRSMLLGVGVALVATVAGAGAGRALGWSLVRRRGLLVVALLAPVACPPFAIAMGLTPVLLRARVPETFGVLLVLTVFALPYTCYVFAAAYSALDPALEEQARLLGATARQAFVRVTLPALRPAVAAAVFLAFLVGWSDYIVTLVIGGGQLVTLPLLIAAAASGTGNEPVLAALSVVSVVPPVLALLFGQALSGRRGLGREIAVSAGGVEDPTAVGVTTRAGAGTGR